jgi:mannose-P-dolichol utilization defect protein 1
LISKFSNIGIKSKYGGNGHMNKVCVLRNSSLTLVAQVSTPTAMLAKALGYIMGIGSMTVYTPILLNLLRVKSSEGLSTQTWIMNLIGLSLAATYPFKMGFPMSSYVELIILSSQAVIILGIITQYKKQYKEFAIGMLTFVVYMAAIIQSNFAPRTLQIIQVIASLICNYANIPQILLSYQQKRAAWSRTTAFMSVGGNLIRVFTTIKLTQDPFFLFGYGLGVITNAILLWQTFLYPSTGKVVEM